MMNRMHRFEERGVTGAGCRKAVPCRSEVRIGMVNYINTAPIYEPWKQRPQRQGWYVLEAPPSQLNRLLAEGELDLGFVSSFEYGMRPERYRILPDLSISASGPVGSVFLFSRIPVSALDGESVLLTNQSDTSVALTRIILEEFYQIRPRYSSGNIDCAAIARHRALLAIGDQALRLKEEGRFPFCLDLGEIWSQQTGLPFVFAVFAVREEFCQREPELLKEVHAQLVQCRNEGYRDLAAICAVAAPRIPMDVDHCYRYLRCVEHDLSEAKREALVEFFSYLMQRNEIGVGALPLKFALL